MRNLITSTLIAGATLEALCLSPSVASASEMPSPQLKPAIATAAGQTDFAIANIKNGKLTAAPFSDLRDFAELSNRSGGMINFAPISPATVDRVIHAPAGSDNTLDEIRMTAAASGQRFVIIYGSGADAEWNSFGRRALRDTGLLIPAGQTLSPKGAFKAMIVGSYTGTVYATVTSNTRTGGADDLTRRIEAVLTEISADAEPFVAA